MTITIDRHESGYALEAAMTLPRPREELFPFFADASNLQQITPSRLGFRILTPLPVRMRVGATIEYRLRINGVPVRWTTEITAWEPPLRFVDEQRRGPYRWWRHEHRFKEHGQATVAADRVEYGVPGGAIVHRFFIQRQLRAIFAYRQATLARLFDVSSDLTVTQIRPGPTVEARSTGDQVPRPAGATQQ